MKNFLRPSNGAGKPEQLAKPGEPTKAANRVRPTDPVARRLALSRLAIWRRGSLVLVP